MENIVCFYGNDDGNLLSFFNKDNYEHIQTIQNQQLYESKGDFFKALILPNGKEKGFFCCVIQIIYCFNYDINSNTTSEIEYLISPCDNIFSFLILEYYYETD